MKYRFAASLAVALLASTASTGGSPDDPADLESDLASLDFVRIRTPDPP